MSNKSDWEIDIRGSYIIKRVIDSAGSKGMNVRSLEFSDGVVENKKPCYSERSIYFIESLICMTVVQKIILPQLVYQLLVVII